MPLSEAETIGQEFVELSGAKTLEELRAIPAEKIVELQEEFGRVNPSRMLSFVPNIDNHLLTCGYNDAVTERKKSRTSHICSVQLQTTSVCSRR